MAEQGAYGEQWGQAFGLPGAPALTTRILKKNLIAVTQVRCDETHRGMATPLPREDAFQVGLYMAECQSRDLWQDGKPVRTAPAIAGDVGFLDLRLAPVVSFRSPFHVLSFYLPRAALDAIADDANAPRIIDLDYTPGIATQDRILFDLARLLLPALEHPQQASKLFVDHLMLAVAAHVAGAYGGMKDKTRPASGGLAPWQERRAKEILSAHLDGEVSIEALAQECGLSKGHFSRAFRQSTGLSPHQWLLHRRIEAAKALLLNPDCSLLDVAFACGFSDQSHFTRVYSRLTGVSPGAWRREAMGGRTAATS
jgi:AraC-like DNA-binding protein